MPKIKRLQNPVLGHSEVVLRAGNGRYKSDLRAARFFQYREKNKKLSKPKSFPSELKKVSDKRNYIYFVLSKEFFKVIDRKKAAQNKAQNKATREGRDYKPRKKYSAMDIGTFLGLNQKKLDIIASAYPEIASRLGAVRNEEEVVSDALYVKRVENFEKVVKGAVKKRKSYAFDVQSFEPSSKGRPLPRTKSGKPLQEWYPHQKELGLITTLKNGKDNGAQSIRWTLSRYLKHFLTKEKVTEIAEAYGAKRTLFFNIAFVTNLVKHKGMLNAQDQGILEVPKA